MVARKIVTGIYDCTQNHLDLVSPDGPRQIGAKKAEDIVWQKICEVIERPDHLLEQAPQVVDQIRESQSSSEEERTRIQHELEAVLNERQWAITQARKGAFTVSDIEQQLNQLTFQEITLKRELSSLGEAKNINTLDKWEARSVAPFKPKVWKQLNKRNLIAV